MIKRTLLALSSVVAFYGASASIPVNAGPAFALQLGEPVFCFGFDEDIGQCLLYLGDEQSCASLTPCPQSPFGRQLPQKLKFVGGDTPGVCKVVVPSSAPTVSDEPMCRFPIARE